MWIFTYVRLFWSNNICLLINSTAGVAATVVKPVAVLDDGYCSTASMKNATNESCSSIDDTASEISLSSINNKQMNKKIIGS